MGDPPSPADAKETLPVLFPAMTLLKIGASGTVGAGADGAPTMI
jgi:hypothetical protein